MHFCIFLLCLISYSNGEKNSHKQIGSPVSCGNVRVVDQYDSFVISHAMITRLGKRRPYLKNFLNNNTLSSARMKEVTSIISTSTKRPNPHDHLPFFNNYNINHQPKPLSPGVSEYPRPTQPYPRPNAFHTTESIPSQTNQVEPDEDSYYTSTALPQLSKKVSFEEHAEKQFEEFRERKEPQPSPQTLPRFPSSPPPQNSGHVGTTHVEDRQLGNVPKMDGESQPVNNGPPEQFTTARTMKAPNQRKINPFVQHLINKARAKEQGSTYQNVPSYHNPNGPWPTIRPSNNVVASDNKNPLSLFQSLRPEQLEQLRQILNAAAGPYKPPSEDVNNSELLYTVSDRRSPRYRTKRSVGYLRMWKQRRHNHANVNEPVDGSKCTVTFKKGRKCRKLVVKIQYWIDGARDCSLEHLLIKDMKSIKSLCGSNDNIHPFNIVGSEVILEHSVKSSPGKIQFRGIVECDT